MSLLLFWLKSTFCYNFYSLQLYTDFKILLSLLMRKHTRLRHVTVSRPQSDVLTNCFLLLQQRQSPILRDGKWRCCYIRRFNSSGRGTQETLGNTHSTAPGGPGQSGKGLPQESQLLRWQARDEENLAPWLWSTFSCHYFAHVLYLSSPPHLFCSIPAYAFPI